MEDCTPDRVDCAALDRLGDQIAELSVHLEAATARLLDLIREFDERGGWNTGFSSCAAWLSWLDSNAPGQSVLEDGVRVSAETSQRLACDASRVVMQHGRDGRVVEVAARTRTIPPALRRALHHRDRGCRFPGCVVRFGQGHHIRHWAQGGPTTLSNLALLCRRHHRAVHEEGYQLERLPAGELRFRRPNGWIVPDVPPPPKVPDKPVELLRALNDAEGLVLNRHTATPGWLGERLNVAYAIDVLHPLAIRAQPPRPQSSGVSSSSPIVVSS
jgi:hypothetical protein